MLNNNVMCVTITLLFYTQSNKKKTNGFLTKINIPMQHLASHYVIGVKWGCIEFSMFSCWTEFVILYNQQYDKILLFIYKIEYKSYILMKIFSMHVYIPIEYNSINIFWQNNNSCLDSCFKIVLWIDFIQVVFKQI